MNTSLNDEDAEKQNFTTLKIKTIQIKLDQFDETKLKFN